MVKHNVESSNEELFQIAEEVADAVQALRRLSLRSFQPDIAENGLTLPQTNVLEELTKEDGLSLKELSARMGLSHSTVSGIVDRLQRRGYIRRTVDPKDRRYSCIFLSQKVSDYVQRIVPSRRIEPFLKALTLASVEERQQILAGTSMLRRLLESAIADDHDDDAVRVRVHQAHHQSKLRGSEKHHGM